MNFSAARTNMVDSQINTMGVVNDDVLNAFRTVPREMFVPEEERGIAYLDEDMPMSNGRFMMEPVTHARLLQSAAPVPEDTVLDVGCGTGYSSAILASIVSRVVAVEPDSALLARAESNWSALGCESILPHCGPASEGCGTHAPYSLIIMNGSAADISPDLLVQLAPHGRMLAVIRNEQDRIGRAVIITKAGNGGISERVLFDAAVPYLPGLEPRPGFVF